MFKRFFSVCVALVLVCGSVFAIPGFSGKGVVDTASTTSTQYTGFKSNKLSIKNVGDTETIHIQVNTTVADFDTDYAAGDTIPVPPGEIFTFDTQRQDTIKNFVVRTDANTSDFIVGSF